MRPCEKKKSSINSYIKLNGIKLGMVAQDLNLSTQRENYKSQASLGHMLHEEQQPVILASLGG